MKNQQENSTMTATHLNANENIVEASKKMTQPVRRLSPKKLLLSKWTAVSPRNKEKHFMVTKLVLSDDLDHSGLSNAPVELIELEAVYSKNVIRLAWRELTDSSLWHQGWK
ncbi:TIGR02450 family Trp-rich protein [Undibacterium sp. RTI2.1]|uniref:TIGR02450 family Trp-rich protein n=1 Tax=unclassified Undibacterium TaxID=2630295 RepID=UPI002B23D7BC|nr:MULTISPECIES: TIGR02450 family Trp-rich protein [unclassified Undibacterium]MEB0032059.1 TIGR02450 family Trp-rich protein [Undibacterium sp. RTI2.1]MEB0115905.1 TIGR02450 family Trp-rich protein [Undibacterium sp. RTI2.2]